MKFGITINIGNYNSMKCESSDHETIRECYMEIFAASGDDFVYPFRNGSARGYPGLYFGCAPSFFSRQKYRSGNL